MGGAKDLVEEFQIFGSVFELQETVLNRLDVLRGLFEKRFLKPG